MGSSMWQHTPNNWEYAAIANDLGYRQEAITAARKHHRLRLAGRFLACWHAQICNVFIGFLASH